MYSITFFLSFKIWYIIWLYYKCIMTILLLYYKEPIWHRSTRSKSSYIKVNFVFWNFFIHNSHPFCLLGRALFYGPCSPFLLSRGRNFINKNILMLYKLRKKRWSDYVGYLNLEEWPSSLIRLEATASDPRPTLFKFTFS